MALRSRVLAAMAAALPAGCTGSTAPSPAQAAQASPGGSIPASPANGPQSLSETGSTLLFPVLRTWAAAYRQQHANVSITTAGTGSGKGIAEARLGPGPGTLLAAAASSSTGAGAHWAAAGRDVRVWYTVIGQAYTLDSKAQYTTETALVIGPGAYASTAGFARVEADLSRAIDADHAVFHSNAMAGRSTFTGLDVVIILAAALMAAGAGTVLADLAAEDPADWRIAWYHGLRELAGGNPAGARAAFDAVADALPGELAAKLALGFAAEAAADHYFRLVWTVDHAYIGAVFGLARARLAAGDTVAAIAALAAVPDTSSHHLAAQVTAVRIQVSPRPGQAQVSPDDLGEAGARVDRLKPDAIQMEYLTAEVLRAALACAEAGGAVPGGRLLGCEFTERGLRSGLERSYRAQARLAPDRRRRIELVETANSVRPRMWI